MIPEEIYAYYVSDDFKPVLPDNLGFRHFRFKDAKGIWKKAPHKIQNEDDLKRWITRLGCLDVYYGTACWINPHRVSAKHGGTGPRYIVADNLLLSHDLVFDIDAPTPVTLRGLDAARKSANNIYELMKKHKGRFTLKYFAFTGSKGFRLSYEDGLQSLPGDPRKRVHFVEKERNLFISQFLKDLKQVTGPLFYKLDAFFDVKITTNVMCVVRVLGTVHSETGFLTVPLKVSDVRLPIKKLLNHVPYIGKMRPGIPEGEMTKQEGRILPRPRLLQSADDVSGLASLPFQFYLSNKVLGMRKGFVPIFSYNEGQKSEAEVMMLQKKNNLGSLFVYTHEDKTYYLSLKAMQRRQLQKILNQSSSGAKYSFIRKHRVIMPYDADFVKEIPGTLLGQESRGHHHFARPGQPEPESRFICGWDQVEIGKAEN